MKRYITPSLKIIKLDNLNIICTSNSEACPKFADSVKLPNEDTSLFEHMPSNPKYLKRLLPLLCGYNDLDSDMKQVIRKFRFARVIRRFDILNIPYYVIAEIEQVNDDEFITTYIFLGNSGKYILIAINVENIIDSLVRQIREKSNEGYKYHLSKEVRKKLPVFSKLMDNAKKQKESIPYLSTIDSKNEHLLLMAFFNEESIENQKGIWVLQESILKIAIKLAEEVDKAGLLNQSKATLIKRVLRISLLANRLN